MAKKKTAVKPAVKKSGAPPVPKPAEEPKRSSSVSVYSIADLGKLSSAASRAIAEETRNETGDMSMSTLREQTALLLGIPCPSLGFEILIGATAIPLEKFIQIYGPTGIGKSGLAFEFFRWIRSLGGNGSYFENESKFNPIWAQSIIGWGALDNDAVRVISCDSIDGEQGWNKMVQRDIYKQKRSMMGPIPKSLATWGPLPRKGFPGKIYPWIGIVDSLLGKSSQETMDKVRDQGLAGRGYPVEALIITKYFPGLVEMLRGWPFLFLTINHQKLHEKDGRTEGRRAGGQGVNFYGSYEFELKRIGRIKQAALEGNKLIVRCAKNSYGVDDRRLPVNVVWTQSLVTDAATGLKTCQQRTVWDWFGATVDYLLNNQGAIFTEARKITGLHKKTVSQSWSRLLGGTEKEPLSNSDAGRLLQANPEMLLKLRHLFGVSEIQLYRPGLPYDRQKLERKRAIRAQD